MENLIRHYDLLVESGNDPFRDPPILQAYMDKWDGEAFLRMMNLESRPCALEIGVGTGRLAARVLPHCAHLTGIDCSMRTIERARENLGETDKLTLLCGDFMKWPFEERFDLIYASLTLWHIADKRRAIEKAASLLQPGGYLALSLGKTCDEELCCFEGVNVTMYPDDPQEICAYMRQAGLRLAAREETEFAVLLCARLT